MYLLAPSVASAICAILCVVSYIFISIKDLKGIGIEILLNVTAVLFFIMIFLFFEDQSFDFMLDKWYYVKICCFLWVLSVSLLLFLNTKHFKNIPDLALISVVLAVLTLCVLYENNEKNIFNFVMTLTICTLRLILIDII